MPDLCRSDTLCMALICRCLLLFTAVTAFSADLDFIGVTTLRSFDPGLTGTNVRVAQPEAGDPMWQVKPAVVGQPQSLFTWLSSAGSAGTFPNALGSESGHADDVGNFFYGITNGVAPGVLHVDN